MLYSVLFMDDNQMLLFRFELIKFSVDSIHRVPGIALSEP